MMDIITTLRWHRTGTSAGGRSPRTAGPGSDHTRPPLDASSFATGARSGSGTAGSRGKI